MILPPVNTKKIIDCLIRLATIMHVFPFTASEFNSYLMPFGRHLGLITTRYKQSKVVRLVKPTLSVR